MDRRRLALMLHSNIRSGANLVMLHHLAHLATCGHDVTVVFQEAIFGDSIDHTGLRLPVRYLGDDGGAPFDLVFTNWWECAYQFARLPARRYAYYCHGDERLLYPDRSRDLFIDTVYREALDLFAVNQSLATRLAGLSGREVPVIPPGVDVQHSRMAAPLLPPASGHLRVLVEGPVGGLKRVPETVAMLKSIAGIEIVHVSADGSGDPAWRIQLLGRVPYRDMASVYKSCAVVVKLSALESFAMPVLEGFAAGATAVVAAFPGHEAYVRDDDNAIVVPVDDWAAARAAVERLRDDPALLARLQDGAAHTVVHFDWQRVCHDFGGRLTAMLPAADAPVCRLPLLDTYRQCYLDTLAAESRAVQAESRVAAAESRAAAAESRAAAAASRDLASAERLQAIYQSTSWRTLEPARWVGRRHPRLARLVRRGLKLGRADNRAAEAGSGARAATERLQAILENTNWRVLELARRVVRRHPRLARLVRRGLKPVWWSVTSQLSQTIARATGPGLDSGPAPIVFVSGFPGTPSETYRVIHPRAALDEFHPTLGIAVHEMASNAAILKRARIMVLFRVAWSTELARIIDEARKNGCLIVYDVDDYVFEPAIATPEIVDGIRFLSDADRVGYSEGVRAYRQTLEAADCCIVSTEFLASKVRLLGKPVYVLPNAVGPGMLGRSDQALRQRRNAGFDGKLRIGYAAGTLTHQRDFGVVADVLARVLREYENVILIMVGQVDLSEFSALSALASRIELRPAVPHHELPNELARFDINIAPLEIGNPFCEAKSELKFFDAAILEIPTVASATAPFRAAIRHGVSGFLASTSEEWLDNLRRLIEDGRLRIRVGKLARATALRQFGPGSLRENVKYVFEALQRRQVTATPPRGLGYDHLLYAINYLPAPSPAKPSRQRSNGSSLDLHWVVPHFSIGWGGMTNIFRVIQQLESFGHRSTLWVHNPPAGLSKGPAGSEYYRKMIAENFIPIAAAVYPLPSNLDRICGDAVIATDHVSAYPARAIANVERRFYFLQDHESEFSPAGSASLFARATYHFGFDALSNGAWLHEMAISYGMWSMQWEQAADPSHYFTLDAQNRQLGHIAFCARQETPRRAVELGYMAFELLVREEFDFHVDLFGADNLPGPMPFSYTHHGVLSARALGELYRQASVGMVFSATNYSIIPREMMACGLPVVELCSESSRRSFPGGVAALADPTPESVAAHVKTLLRDHQRREQLARRAREFVADFSWEKSARDIEDALLFRLGRSGRQTGPESR